MKRSYPLAFALLASFSLLAQTKPVNIVFDVTSGDTLVHQQTVRHVSMMAAAYPKSQFEIVIYSGSWPMIVKDQSKVAKGMEQLMAQKNVSVKVCKMTLERNKVETARLFQGVEIVPDGILEIVTKQGQGWGYIKEAQ